MAAIVNKTLMGIANRSASISSVIVTTTTTTKIFDIKLNNSSVKQVTGNGTNVAISWLSTGRIQIPLYATILLLAIVGNSLVILTLIQNRRMRTITNVFLLNLAISDILLGVLCMPFTLIGTLLRDFVFGEVMCKLLPYLQGKEKQYFVICDVRRYFFMNKFLFFKFNFKNAESFNAKKEYCHKYFTVKFIEQL